MADEKEEVVTNEEAAQTEGEEPKAKPKKEKAVEPKVPLVLTPIACFNRCRKNLIHLRALMARHIDEKKWNKALYFVKELQRDAPQFQDKLDPATKKEFTSVLESLSGVTDLASFKMQDEMAKSLKQLNEALGKSKVA